MTSEPSGPAPLLGIGTWTQQGPATLVVREAGWVVLVPGLRKEVTEAAWSVLGEKPAPEEFLEKLVETAGLESDDKLTAILFGVLDGTRGTFGVKGKTPLAVYTADGSHLVAGSDDEPFLLRTFEDVRRIAFGDLPAEQPIGAPRVDAGIARVRGFVQVSIDPATLDDEERAALVEQVEKDGRSIEDPEAKKRRAERPAASTPTSTPPSSTSPTNRTPAVAGRKSGEMPSTVSRGGSPSRAGAPAPASDGPNMFDGLFSERTHEPTAPAAGPGTAGPSTAAAPGPQTAALPDATSVPPAHPAPAASSSTPAGSGSSSAAGPEATATATAAGTAAATETTSAKMEPPSPRRRLVSTSLFDRKRRTTDAAEAAPVVPVPAAASPSAEQPAADQEHGLEAGPTSATDAAGEPTGTSAPASETPVVPETSAEPTVPVAAETAPEPTTSEPTAAVSPVSRQTAAAPAPTPPASIPTPEPLDEDEDASPVTQVAPIDDGEGPEDEAERDSGPRRAPAPRRAVMAETSGADLDTTGAYDDLFGKTVFRRIEDAAVRRSEEDADGPEESQEDRADQASSPSAPAPRVVEEEPVDPTPSVSSATSPAALANSGGEFIDWVPGVGRAAPEIAQAAARRAAEPRSREAAYPQVHMAQRPPAPQPGSRPAPVRADAGTNYDQIGPPQPFAGPVNAGQAGQHVGNGGPSSGGRSPSEPMVGRHASAPHPVAPSGPPPTPPRVPVQDSRHSAPSAGLAQQFAPAAAGSGQSAGSVVALSGLVCPNGHANSTERSTCRACGAPLQGTPRTVARPPLGAIEVSTGERFILDRTAIIGRRPRASRVSGHDVPQLITVPSPQQDISRSHLELRLEGWHVVALDLGTTNGTTLYREGTDPVRLRPREGVVLHEGDHLDLGDAIHLRMRERA